MTSDLFSTAVPIVAIISAVVSAVSTMVLALRARRNRAYKELMDLVAIVQNRGVEINAARDALNSIKPEFNEVADAEKYIDDLSKMRNILEIAESAHEDDVKRNRRITELANLIDENSRNELMQVVKEGNEARNSAREARLSLLRDLTKNELLAKKLKATSLKLGNADNG